MAGPLVDAPPKISWNISLGFLILAGGFPRDGQFISYSFPSLCSFEKKSNETSQEVSDRWMMMRPLALKRKPKTTPSWPTKRKKQVNYLTPTTKNINMWFFQIISKKISPDARHPTYISQTSVLWTGHLDVKGCFLESSCLSGFAICKRCCQYLPSNFPTKISSLSPFSSSKSPNTRCQKCPPYTSQKTGGWNHHSEATQGDCWGPPSC